MGVLKNDVGRPSNKTIRTRFILKLIGLILVVGLAFVVGYMLSNTETKELEKEVVKEEKIVNEKLPLDSELVKELYNRVVGIYLFDPLVDGERKTNNVESLYDWEKGYTDVKDLSDDFKASMALNYAVAEKYNNVFENEISINYNEQKQAYEKIFGEKYDIKDFYSYTLYHGKVTLNEKKEYELPEILATDFDPGRGCTLVDAETEGDKLYLYEAYWENDAADYMGTDYNGEYYYYKETTCGDTYPCEVIFKSKNAEDTKNIIAHKDKFYQFKFTFVKNDNNYVFEKVELID